MSLVSREIIEQARETAKLQQEDRMYFIDKALTCCGNGDVGGAMQALKKLKLLEESSLQCQEIDWNYKSLWRFTL
jgi:hypothetical protein